MIEWISGAWVTKLLVWAVAATIGAAAARRALAFLAGRLSKVALERAIVLYVCAIAVAAAAFIVIGDKPVRTISDHLLVASTSNPESVGHF